MVEQIERNLLLQDEDVSKTLNGKGRAKNIGNVDLPIHFANDSVLPRWCVGRDKGIHKEL